VALDLVVMLGMHDSHATPGPLYWDMEPHPLQVHGDTQFEWFDKVMAASTADYLWVYGHYPMYNADGPHEALVNKIGAQMTKYNASGYFAGHEHTVYEFTNKDKTQAYIVTGPQQGYPPKECYPDTKDSCVASECCMATATGVCYPLQAGVCPPSTNHCKEVPPQFALIA
jgi:hypothetical protein